MRKNESEFEDYRTRSTTSQSKLSSDKSRIPVKKERERELHEQIALHWNEHKIHMNELAADIITLEVRNEDGILRHVQNVLFLS